MERRISTLILLSLVLSGVGGITVKIPKTLYEYARGDNITLPCTFSLKPNFASSLVVISWSGEHQDINIDAEPLILTYYSNIGTTDITSQYEGRVSLDVDVAKGKADLKLFSITSADTKVFECRVQVPGDDKGTPSAKTNVVVLVAPSTPICKIQGKAEYGQNINLTCLSEEGMPVPIYSWKSQDVRNMPRVADPRTTDKGGILSLYNISKDTSGYYTCTSSNKIRSASCNITLAVLPPSINIGSTAGIIGGVAAVLVVLIIIIYCCCCRKKKKKKEEEYAMGVREAEEYSDKQPVRNGASRLPDGQEAERAHDDSSVRRPAESADRRSEYDDRRSEYDDRRSEYDDRRSEYDDRRSDYTDRRSDYTDRRSDYDDRRSDYDDRRDKHSDRNERYDDHRYDDHRDDDHRDDDRRDRRNDVNDHHDGRPPVPANKPPSKDFHV